MKNETSISNIINAELPALAQAYFDIVLCKGSAASYSESNINRIMKAFESLLPKVSVDYIKIGDITTAEEAIRAATQGNITLSDAAKLIDSIHKKTEIHEAQELLEKVDELLHKSK